MADVVVAQISERKCKLLQELAAHVLSELVLAFDEIRQVTTVAVLHYYVNVSAIRRVKEQKKNGLLFSNVKLCFSSLVLTQLLELSKNSDKFNQRKNIEKVEPEISNGL